MPCVCTRVCVTEAMSTICTSVCVQHMLRMMMFNKLSDVLGLSEEQMQSADASTTKRPRNDDDYNGKLVRLQPQLPPDTTGNADCAVSRYCKNIIFLLHLNFAVLECRNFAAF